MTRKRTYRYIKAYAYFTDECKKERVVSYFMVFVFTTDHFPVRAKTYKNLKACVVYNYNNTI